MNEATAVIGVPTDYGADRRGVDMGPSAIRYAGLTDRIENIGLDCIDQGDLDVPKAAVRDDVAGGDVKAKYLAAVEEVSRRLADEVAGTLADGRRPLLLGGDHSVAIGSIAGAARDSDIGVLWFDAHGDFNTPATTPSGNIHGMSLAAALGRGSLGETDWASASGLAESNVAMVGVRDVDDDEGNLLESSDVTVYTMSEIDARGLSAVVAEALDVVTAGVEGIHVSVDLDFLDPKEAPGVGTPVRGGATYREAHSAMEAVAALDKAANMIRTIEFVEVNPILDHRNETARLATELAASVLGKRVMSNSY